MVFVSPTKLVDMLDIVMAMAETGIRSVVNPDPGGGSLRHTLAMSIWSLAIIVKVIIGLFGWEIELNCCTCAQLLVMKIGKLENFAN